MVCSWCSNTLRRCNICRRCSDTSRMQTMQWYLTRKLDDAVMPMMQWWCSDTTRKLCAAVIPRVSARYAYEGVIPRVSARYAYEGVIPRGSASMHMMAWVTWRRDASRKCHAYARGTSHMHETKKNTTIRAPYTPSGVRRECRWWRGAEMGEGYFWDSLAFRNRIWGGFG